MNRIVFTATQARRCKPSRQLRHAIRLLNRRINGGLGCFPDDDQGEAFLTVMRSLGLPPVQIYDRDAPWFDGRTAQDQQRLNDAYRDFVPTPENICKRIGLTAAQIRKYAYERVKCGKGFSRCQKCRECNSRREWHWKYPMLALLQIIPDDPDELRQREIDKNAKRKAKHEKERAERAAQYGPREIAVIEAMIRLSRQPGFHHPDYEYSVPSILRNIERSDNRTAFPHKRSTFHVAIHNVLDRLKRRRVVTTTTTGKRGRQVRLVTLGPCIAMQYALDATPPAKPLKHRRLALDKPAPDLMDGGDHEGECPDVDAKGSAVKRSWRRQRPIKQPRTRSSLMRR